MAKTKVKGLGFLLYCDHDNNASFTEIDCVVSMTSPPESFEELDGTCLGDTIEKMGRGIQKAGEFSFDEIWSLSDHASDIITGLKTSGTTCAWKLTSPAGTNILFSGYVFETSPANIVKNEYLKRTVKVRCTTAVTYS